MSIYLKELPITLYIFLYDDMTIWKNLYQKFIWQKFIPKIFDICMVYKICHISYFISSRMWFSCIPPFYRQKFHSNIFSFRQRSHSLLDKEVICIKLRKFFFNEFYKLFNFSQFRHSYPTIFPTFYVWNVILWYF